MLEFQRRPVEVNPLPIYRHIKPVPPPSFFRSFAHFDHHGAVTSGGDRRQLRGSDFAIRVRWHPLEPALHVQPVVVSLRPDQHELALSVERVSQVVEGYDVGISEDACH